MLELERRQLHDVVLAREDPGQPGLEIAAAHRAEEADAPEVHADDGNAGPEKRRQRAQDGPVAAEHHRDVGSRRIRPGLEPLLLRLARRIQQLDAVLLRDRLQARQPGADLLRLAVRNHRGARNGLRRVSRGLLRSSGRCHRDRRWPGG